MLLAFLLPFGGAHLPLLIIIWSIAAILSIEGKQLKEALRNRWVLVMLAFFFMHVISGLFSANFKEAVTSVEIKLSFLAFPVCLFMIDHKPEVFRRIFTAFVSGCLFALLTCLGRALFFYLKDGSNFFYYSSFSFMIHTACFSMYLLMSWIILQLAYPVWFRGDKMAAWLRYAFSIFFIIGIFLCASKIGIIAFFVVQAAVILLRYRSRLTAKKVVMALALFVILIAVAYKAAPTPFQRLTSAFDTATSSASLDKTSGESTAVRILIWRECVQIISGHFLFGVSAGDANDVLIAHYKEHGLTGALEHNLNAHDQFFQTFIGLGVLGFALLLYLTIGVLASGFSQKHYMLGLFGIVITLNFLVESMLQRQDGTLFFVFFLCLLLNYDPLRKPDMSAAP